MSVNTMDFEQSATLLAAIASQATGQTAVATINPSEFVTQAQTVLATGYDRMTTAISQVLSYTIYSAREYLGSLRGMRVDGRKWGGIVRKINYIDMPLVDDEVYSTATDATLANYRFRKDLSIQTNFYGDTGFEQYTMFYKNQLDQAFTGPDEFGTYMAGLLTKINNQLEQTFENTGRAVLCNLATAKSLADANSVIHLLTEYNADTGLTLTATTVMQPGNYEPFVKWMAARIQTIKDLLAVRGVKFHVNPTAATPVGGYIQRHTPADRLKIYMNSGVMNNIQARVLTGLYNKDDFKMVDTEAVPFWQSPDSPAKIQYQPSFIDNTGTATEAPAAVTLNNVLGIMFDEDAAGWAVTDEWMGSNPWHAFRGISNLVWHYHCRWWNDLTENAVILMLD